MHFCPNCGKEFDNNNVEICECGFDFNTTLSCPYKVSNRCIFNNTTPCENYGLNYESCDLYWHKIGVKK